MAMKGRDKKAHTHRVSSRWVDNRLGKESAMERYHEATSHRLTGRLTFSDADRQRIAKALGYPVEWHAYKEFCRATCISTRARQIK